MAERGYTATKDQLLARLARVEGQVRGVSRMVEDDRYCIDVLTQISAIQAALDKTALGLLDEHARHCLIGEGGGPEAPDAQADELMAAVGRLVSR
ncbi:MAG: Repressor CsoR of the copZA operon [uncultured Solirubrobacterales bacterium]|uniref:Repressor CsoR of the copZA operon n=1 Tax=uncultured Solirubrobacterales bacterium TaxID=768556 RepID=A0A6J4S2S4_9ACTN|nr:MAG: Repressor CsoR of the copZA operon [uncultured Solirubrobacterales bacterium]